MSKRILEFSWPEEQTLYKEHAYGPALFAAVREFDEFLRKKVKYEDVETMSIEAVRSNLYTILEEEGISIWDG